MGRPKGSGKKKFSPEFQETSKVEKVENHETSPKVSVKGIHGIRDGKKPKFGKTE